MDSFADFKQRTRETWALGNYAEIARFTLPASQVLLDACAISAGQEVLDVAAGNGNLALLAAREGAAVVASDIAPAMVELGRERTGAEGYDVEWVEADVEELPFEDGRFDCCASAFGAMFAPQPERTAAEMFRVVRPGGTVGLAAWTPEGFQGRVFAIGSRFVPSAGGAADASQWGVEDVVRERLADLASSVQLERHTIRQEFDTPEGFFEFSRNAGPTVVRMRSLSPEQRDAMRAEVLAAIDEFSQADDGRVALEVEYLVTVARKRG